MKLTHKTSVAMTVLSSFLLVSPVVNAATGGKTPQKPLSYYLGDTKPYDQPVSMSIGWTEAGAQGLPSGDSQQKNQYVDYIQKKLNVQLNWSWISPATDTTMQKQSLAISSGNIPDVMEVNYPLLKQLEAADMIQPMTSAYQKYASPFVKDYYASGDNQALKMATYKGQLMAIPDTQIGYQYDMLWVRRDWMNKLHLKAPKTINDITQMAKAFVKAHLGGAGTVGIVGRPAISSYFAGGTFDSVFSAYGAYPGQWIVKNGKVSYGSIQPQVKTALQQLHSWYAQGLLDPQFATRSANDELALLNTDKSGILIAPWWVTWGDLAPSLKRDWVSYAAPLDTKGKFNVVAPASSGSFIVVRKGYENPDAVMRVLNLTVAGYRSVNPETNDFYKGLNVQWTNWPLAIDLDHYDAIPRMYKDVMGAIKTHNTSSLSPAELNTYSDVVKFNKNPSKNMNLWPEVKAYTTAAGAVYQSESVLNQVHPLIVIPDSSLSAQSSALASLETRTFLGIVVGQYPINKFDSFVKQWHSMGGDQMTASYQKQVGN